MDNYEEKYNKALERVRDLMTNQNPPAFDKHLIETVFPELKESENERIRKKVIEVLKLNIKGAESQMQASRGVDRCFEIYACNKVIAWLEKQGEGKSTIFIPKFRLGDKLVSAKNPRLTYEVLEVGHINELGNPEYKVEIFTDGKAENPHNIHYMECCKVDEWAKLIEHKPSDKVEPKFNVGDWIIGNEYGEVLKVTKADANSYEIATQDGEVFDILKEDVECNHRLWNIADARDGDVLATNFGEDDLIVMYKSRCTIDTINVHCCLGNEFTCSNIGLFNAEDVKPATKEQRDTLFAKMKEAGYEWYADKKELKKIEHKMFNPDKVIEWLNDQACQGWIEDVEVDKFVDKFKNDFGLLYERDKNSKAT